MRNQKETTTMKQFITALVLAIMATGATTTSYAQAADVEASSANRPHCDQNWRSMCCARSASMFDTDKCRDFRAVGCCPTNDDIGYCADPNVTIEVNIDSAIGACLEQPIQVCDQVGKCAEVATPEPPADFFASICPRYFNGEPFPTWNCMKVHHLAMKGRRHKAESMAVCANLVAQCLAHGGFNPAIVP